MPGHILSWLYSKAVIAQVFGPCRKDLCLSFPHGTNILSYEPHNWLIRAEYFPAAG